MKGDNSESRRGSGGAGGGTGRFLGENLIRRNIDRRDTGGRG